MKGLDPKTLFALNVVREAGFLAREVQLKTSAERLEKSDRSPVTVADFAVQALVGNRLSKAFPHDLLVAEEESELLTSDEGKPLLDKVVRFLKGYLPEADPENVCNWIQLGTAAPGPEFWTLDPIDGTKGFMRGGQYAIAMAYIAKGEVQIGVLGCPDLTPSGAPESGTGALFVAKKGKGTWSTTLQQGDGFERLRVSKIKEVAEARVLRSVESGHTDVTGFRSVLKHLGTSADPVLMDSQAKYAALATGRAELLFRLLSPKQPDYKEKIWDQAAGSLVVEEAGGLVTDLAGLRLGFGSGRKLIHNRGVVASNGRLHQNALAALEKLGLNRS
jgi:3'(2'), 5'-bisphosphate nucleotidase